MLESRTQPAGKLASMVSRNRSTTAASPPVERGSPVTKRNERIDLRHSAPGLAFPHHYRAAASRMTGSSQMSDRVAPIRRFPIHDDAAQAARLAVAWFVAGVPRLPR